MKTSTLTIEEPAASLARSPEQRESPPAGVQERSLRRVLFLLFFLSGYCGLVYQIAWVRLAFSHFGVITPVLSVILSTFMLGLALGSFAAGRWIAAITVHTKRSAIYWYALTELLIGVGALAVPALFAAGETWLLPSGEMNSTPYLVTSAAIIALTILPPCLLMGATFPVMMAFLRERNDRSGTSFSYLYVANVMGATGGVLMAAGVLIEVLGLQRTLLVAVGLNMVIALIGALVGFRAPRPWIVQQGGAPPNTCISSHGLSWHESRLILLTVFLTGFISMALEVVWTRAFTPIMNTTICAFALILSTYLLATWTGSCCYRAHQSLGRMFSPAQLMAGLALSAFLPLLLNDPRLHPQRINVLISIAPFCFLLGYLTPKLIDQYSGGRPAEAGVAYGVNVVGCILGPLLASYVLLPTLGVKYIMATLAIPFLLLLVGYARPLWTPFVKATWGLAAIFLGCALGFTYTYEEPFEGFPPGVIIRRDHTATVISYPKSALLVNGISMTVRATMTKAMAHFPLACLQEPPRSALVICFGMGTTYRSLLSWKIRVTAVELIPSVTAVFGNYFDDAEQVLGNPQGRIVIDDGRRFLRRTAETFDVVTIDPPPPVEAAASSLLYSKEFYALVKKRLKPSGILHQWFPGGERLMGMAIAQSLTQSFPYVKAYRSLEGWGWHFLASMSPIHVPTPEQFLARLPEEARRDLAEWEPHQDVQAVVSQILARPVDVAYFQVEDPRVVITDDHPYNEYNFLRRSWARLRRISRPNL